MQSHDADTATDAAPRLARTLLPRQRCEVRIFSPGSGEDRLVLTSRERLLEAPNWHPSGDWVVVNADGVLLRLSPFATDPDLRVIDGQGLPELNNDHLIDPDGRSHLVSANDGHIYRLPWEGGLAERITTDKEPARQFRHFLHGVSPDGGRIAYVGTEDLDGDPWGTRALWSLDLRSGDEVLFGDGFSPADGPESSPDGRWLYFNSEMASAEPGHAQLFRLDLEQGDVEQLTVDERVNWFPHPSPDDSSLCYLSYPAGTLGHPADLPVSLRLRDLTTGSTREIAAFNGGQGTVNVPSWSPDSRWVAYVSYPFDE